MGSIPSMTRDKRKSSTTLHPRNRPNRCGLSYYNRFISPRLQLALYAAHRGGVGDKFRTKMRRRIAEVKSREIKTEKEKKEDKEKINNTEINELKN